MKRYIANPALDYHPHPRSTNDRTWRAVKSSLTAKRGTTEKALRKKCGEMQYPAFVNYLISHDYIVELTSAASLVWPTETPVATKPIKKLLRHDLYFDTSTIHHVVYTAAGLEAVQTLTLRKVDLPTDLPRMITITIDTEV